MSTTVRCTISGEPPRKGGILDALRRSPLVGADLDITDAGLEHLKGLDKLEEFTATDTKVTDEGVRRLQK